MLCLAPPSQGVEMPPILMFIVNVDWFFISHRLPIALEAMSRGYVVHIATGITDRREELERHGLIVHPLALERGGLGVCNAWCATVELFRLFRAVRPNLVHLVTIKPVLLGGVISRLAGVPAVVAAISGLGYVFTARGFFAPLRRGLVEVFYRVALGHSNIRLIFQNKEDLRGLRSAVGVQDSKVSIIRGSGVDLSKYAPIPAPLGRPIVMMAARLIADKGVREFVNAASLLKAAGCTARFVLVGTVDLANPTSFTQTEVDEWETLGTVECWGHRVDMHAVLSQARIVVLPSYREGLPKVLIEAAACARAVVTTDVPGCRDAIESGVTGLLVKARDASSLASAIQALLNDSSRCEAMGRAGRLLAEREFDVRSVVQTHLLIYRELLES
jgi:glycosyltransferase involved in cell wall biosynthesis